MARVYWKDLKTEKPKDKKTKEGDQAFVFFNLAMKRAKFELSLLPDFYSMPSLGEGFMQSVIAYYSDALTQLSFLKESGRQRPEYLKEKRKQLDKLKEKMLHKVKEYWIVVYS